MPIFYGKGMINIENKRYWIWLSLLNLSVKNKLKLLEKYKEPKNIYK